MFRWLTERLAGWRARHERRRALAGLDSHTLDDVGLTRGAVAAALLDDDLPVTRRNPD